MKPEGGCAAAGLPGLHFSAPTDSQHDQPKRAGEGGKQACEAGPAHDPIVEVNTSLGTALEGRAMGEQVKHPKRSPGIERLLQDRRQTAGRGIKVHILGGREGQVSSGHRR